MENKISFSTLAAMVALATGQPGELCEKFINELMSLVSEALEEGDSVRIKGLGTFKIVEIDSRKSVDVTTGEEIEIPAHRRVIFVPCKELAAIVNAPFEAFEAEEVADDLPTDELMLDPEDEDPDIIDDEDESEPDDSLPENPGEEAADSYDKPEVAGAEDQDKDSGEGKTIVFGMESVIDERSVKGEEFDPLCVNKVISFGRIDGHSDKNPLHESVRNDHTETSPAEELRENEETTVMPSSDSAESQEPIESVNPEATRESGSSDNIEFSEEGGENYAQSEYQEPRRPGRFGRGFLFGFLTAAVVIVMIFLIGVRYGFISTDKIRPHVGMHKGTESAIAGERANSVSKPTAVADSTADEEAVENRIARPAVVDDTTGVPTRPSDEGNSAAAASPKTPEEAQPKYDTVSTTRYLTTMAQEHYGNYNLWPVIYKENQAILGHPDRIKPGTRVVVPPLGKYKVDPENPDDIVAMKREGAAIYARFKKRN